MPNLIFRSNEDTSKKPIISECEERQEIMSGMAFSKLIYFLNTHVCFINNKFFQV